jgi:trimeric autotransporter adhesin
MVRVLLFNIFPSDEADRGSYFNQPLSRAGVRATSRTRIDKYRVSLESISRPYLSSRIELKMNHSAKAYSVLICLISAMATPALAQQPQDPITSDSQANTAMGSNALLNVDLSESACHNTASGEDALYSDTSGSWNTATGFKSLDSNTTGNNNTAAGYQSLLSNTSGTDNTALGYNALQNSQTGSNNIGIGVNAGTNVTSGFNNIAIGASGASNESNTTRIGTQGTQTAAYLAGVTATNLSKDGAALAVFIDANTGQLGTGSSTAGPPGPQGPIGPAGPAGARGATGAQGAAGPAGVTGPTGPQGLPGPAGAPGATGARGAAGPAGVTGPTGPQGLPGPAGAPGATGPQGPAGAKGDTGATGAPGPQGLQGAQGPIGPSGLVLSDAHMNTATGTNALELAAHGANNTANGFESLYSNSSGSNNNASGVEALLHNTTADDNNAMGYATLFENTTGYRNNAVGSQALYHNEIGYANNAQGYMALFQNTSGNFNDAVGYQALYKSATGSYNIAIGEYAGYNLTSGSNNIYIGHHGAAAESGITRIGTPGTQTGTYIAGIENAKITGNAVYVTSSGQLGVLASSERYKTAITPMGANTEKLQQLRPVSFHLKTDPDGSVQYGLIAEEVDKIYPELVIRDDSGKIQGVRYDELAPMLLNELQKQQQRIVAQEAVNSAQAAEIRELKQQQKQFATQEELNDLQQQLQATLAALRSENQLVAHR